MPSRWELPSSQATPSGRPSGAYPGSLATIAHVAATGRPLVHRWADGWLLGGVGMVAWLLVGPHGPGSGWAPITGVLSGAFITLGAMHFGASYHLAYGDGRSSIRRHPYALVVAPTLLLVVAALVIGLHEAGADGPARGLLRGLLVTVFTLTGWHYIKQAYGVGMLAARNGGLRPTRREALVLRYALYPVWAYQVLQIWGVGRGGTYGRYNVGFALVPRAFAAPMRDLALASLAVALAEVVVLAVRARRVPPLGLWGTYLAGGLWFIWPPSYVSAAIVLGGLHGLQYLVCAHRAEVDLGAERGERHQIHRWLCVFGGAAAGGVLLTNWLPEAVGGHLGSAALPGVLGALLFVYFNLHHYAVDATIWRSGGDHVTRITRGPALPGAAAAPSAASTPAGAPRGATAPALT